MGGSQRIDGAASEARTVGACATGNTTAKISLLQGTQLSTISAKQCKSLAAAYLDGNRAGQDWLLSFCAAAGPQRSPASAMTTAGNANRRSL